MHRWSGSKPQKIKEWTQLVNHADFNARFWFDRPGGRGVFLYTAQSKIMDFLYVRFDCVCHIWRIVSGASVNLRRMRQGALCPPASVQMRSYLGGLSTYKTRGKNVAPAIFRQVLAKGLPAAAFLDGFF